MQENESNATRMLGYLLVGALCVLVGTLVGILVVSA